MSKARLAPINEKQLTILRLELQAAVLGFRMRSVIIEEKKCEFKAVYLWMDSEIVINYIKTKQQILESKSTLKSTNGIMYQLKIT